MKRIFVVDIRRNKQQICRGRSSFSICHDIHQLHRLSTAKARSFDELIAQQEMNCPDIVIAESDALVVGIPGPVLDEDKVEMVNVPWTLDMSSLKKRFDMPVFFMNDFMAQGYGCLTLPLSEQMKIKDGNLCDHYDMAVIGAGTGLGHCYLKSDGSGGHIPMPAEAGQIPFAFIDKEELAYREFIMGKISLPYPTGDTVVSGPGLAMLHHFLTGEDLAPDQVARKITPGDRTTRWFSRFYARCCRNFCLSKISASCILFISGGLAGNHPFLVDNDTFRQEFVTSTLKSPFLDQVPVYLNTNVNNGLCGAAYYGFLKL